MAKYSPIRRSDNWFQGERKVFRWPITDAEGGPVDLTGLNLQWRLHAHRGSDLVYITVEPDDFDTPEGDDSSIAVWVVEDTTYTQDGATTQIPAGWHYYELWELTSKTLLAHGGALLQRARRT